MNHLVLYNDLSLFKVFVLFCFFEICNLEDHVFPIRYFSVIASPYSFFIRFSYEGKYSEQPYSASATGATGDWQGSGVSGSGGRPRTRVRTQGKHPLSLRTTETFLGMKASGSGPLCALSEGLHEHNRVCREPVGLAGEWEVRGQKRNHLNI